MTDIARTFVVAPQALSPAIGARPGKQPMMGPPIMRGSNATTRRTRLQWGSAWGWRREEHSIWLLADSVTKERGEMDLIKLCEQLVEHEEWRPVKGFPDYMISSHGRVRSIAHRKGGRANINGGIIVGWIARTRNKTVCRKVSFRKDKQTHEFRVHRLVMETFIGPSPGDDFEVCHNDGNPLNNHLSNLRWDTHKSNVADCIRHGTKKDPPIHMGDRHPRSKLSQSQKRHIASLPYKRGINAELARRFGVSLTHIIRVRRGEWYGSDKIDGAVDRA